MRGYLLQRLISLPLVLFGVSIITFALIQLVPVDPAEVFLRQAQVLPTEEAVELTRIELGLNRPVHQQFLVWLGGALRLDFGKSFISRKPAFDEILYYFPATLQLTAAALAWILVISFPLGIFGALYRESMFDRISRVIAYAGASVPNFWLGFLCIYLFSYRLDMLPTMGRGSAAHLVLPSLTLAIGTASVYIRLLRASMLDHMEKDFTLYARARGVKEKWIIARHVVKNALLPVITAVGMSIGNLLAGSVIVENVFSWPGVGRYIIEAIFNRDYPVIQCYVLLMALIFLGINLLVDITYATLDPRIRLGDKK